MDIDDEYENLPSKFKTVKSKNLSDIQLESQDISKNFINNTISKMPTQTQTHNTAKGNNLNVDFDSDELNNIMDYFMDEDFAPIQKENSVLNEHCEVTNVTFKTNNVREKEITVLTCLEGKVYKVVLVGSWSELEVDKGIISCINIIKIGDMVFINAEFDNQNRKYCISETGNLTQNFIVIEPEILLAPTSIKNAFPCIRRSIFTENFKSVVINATFSKDMVIGSIVHEIFEQALLNGNLDCLSLYKSIELIKRITKNFNLEIMLSGMTQNDVIDTCKVFITNITKFFSEHFISKN